MVFIWGVPDLGHEALSVGHLVATSSHLIRALTEREHGVRDEELLELLPHVRVRDDSRVCLVGHKHAPELLHLLDGLLFLVAFAFEVANLVGPFCQVVPHDFI